MCARACGEAGSRGQESITPCCPHTTDLAALLINNDREPQFFHLAAESSVRPWFSQQHSAKGIATVGFSFIWSRQIAVARPRVFCRCLTLCALPGERHTDTVMQQPREERASFLTCFACVRVSAY